MMKRCARAWVAGVAWAAVQAGAAGVSSGAGTIIDLGHLSTNYFGGSGPVISADGQVVAGAQNNAAGFSTPYRWTAETGMQALPLFDSYNTARIMGINGDGSVIVGSVQQSSVPSNQQAAKWTTAEGVMGLGGTGYPQATGISADGNTVVGSETASGIGNVHWVTWSGDGTKTPLTNVSGIANGVSADGSVIVGESPVLNPAYWTQQTGAVSLPLLPGAAWGEATAVSGDGSTIVGYDTSPEYQVPPNFSTADHMAFRWTADGGLEDLGHLGEKSPGHSDATAMSVSGDGSVIGGYGTGGAFVWDELHGMRRLNDALLSAGIDASGWDLGDVTGISADGLTLVGIGKHHGIASHFFIEVPASVWVPEPGGVTLAVGAAFVALRSRRRRHG